LPQATQDFSNHFTYPFPITDLPRDLSSGLVFTPATLGKKIDSQPDLDLLYFEPFIPRHLARPLFNLLRSSLPFYRVDYKIKRGAIETDIRTPRYRLAPLDPSSTPALMLRLIATPPSSVSTPPPASTKTADPSTPQRAPRSKETRDTSSTHRDQSRSALMS